MPTIPDGPTVTSRMLNGLQEFMAGKGLDFQDHARRAGLDLSLADNPDGFIPFGAVLTLFEAAAKEAGDEAFGLHFAEHCQLCPIGLYHYVVSNAPLLRDALRIRAKFSRLVVSAYDITFTETGGFGTYTWHGPDLHGPRRQFLGYIVMLLVARVRIILNDQSWRPATVRFQHAAPASVGEFKRALGVAPEFDADATSVGFDQASLARALPRADSILFRELQRIIRSLPHAPDKPASILGQVQRALVASFVRDSADESAIAKELGLTVRSLQRALADAGTTFEALRDDTRQLAAHQYVVDTDLPLTEIAFLLGFSELSAFSRAARLWFGEPASGLRKRSRAAASTSAVMKS